MRNFDVEINEMQERRREARRQMLNRRLQEAYYKRTKEETVSAMLGALRLPIGVSDVLYKQNAEPASLRELIF